MPPLCQRGATTVSSRPPVNGPTGADSARGRSNWRGSSSSCGRGLGVAGICGGRGCCGVTGALWGGVPGDVPLEGGVAGDGVRAGLRVVGGAVVAGDCGRLTGALVRTCGASPPPWPEPGPGPEAAVVAAAGAGVASAATGVCGGPALESPEAGVFCSTAGSDGPSATWPSELSPPKPAPAASSTAAHSSAAGAKAVTPAAFVAWRLQSVVNSTAQW